MLAAILGHKLQTNIAAFFLNGVQRAYSLYELRKIFGRSTDKNLSALVRLDFLTVFYKKNVRYFLLNYRNRELAEIKGRILKTTKLTKKYQDGLIELIKKMPKIKLAVLSGLFLGNVTASCDLLLVGEITRRRLDEFVKTAEKYLGQEINYGLFSVSEFEMRKNMFDRFIKDIFENKHTVVIAKLKI